jgi:hypothetical protein
VIRKGFGGIRILARLPIDMKALLTNVVAWLFLAITSTAVRANYRANYRVRSINRARYSPLLAELGQQFVGGKPSWRWGLSYHRAVTTPRPLSGVFDYRGSDRIKNNVAGKF